MFHKKVLGTNDGTPTKAGGNDWDAEHVFAVGEFLLVGTLGWNHDLGDAFVTGVVSQGLLAATPNVTLSGNVFSCTVSLSPVPRPANKYAYLRATLADSGAVGVNGYRLAIYNNDAGDIQIYWLNAAGSIVAPPVSSAPSILLFASISDSAP